MNPGRALFSRLAASEGSWASAAARTVHPAFSTSTASDVDSTAEDAVGLHATIAAGLAAVTVPVELAPDHDGRSITKELLLETPTYDVWLMGWPSGASVDLHAHRTLVAFSVVSGTLHEWVGADDGDLRTLPAGTTVELPAGVVHRMSNIGGSVATTIHVHEVLEPTRRTDGPTP